MDMSAKKGILENYEGDVILYHGTISRAGYQELSDDLEKNLEKKPKVCLVLVTHGGDPDAGYRIARALNLHYDEVEILIPDICKSAGTLICIGAHKLIIGDRGELGPLDIQLSKPDEMAESMSGLDIIQALGVLESQVLVSFNTYLLDLQEEFRLRTKLTADIATKLTDGFISPLLSKIDPVTLGEHQRAMQIAQEYGARLHEATNSLKSGSLEKLVSGYPSHSFVIDRKEASELFSRVEQPEEATAELCSLARQLLPDFPYLEDPVVLSLVEQADESDTNEETEIGDIHENDQNDE